MPPGNETSAGSFGALKNADRNIPHLQWVDALKGFGILTVVLGHMLSKESDLSSLRSLFSMPLFFFISGYLFKPAVDAKGYFLKKCVHLLVPYAVFLVLLFLIPQLIILFQASSLEPSTFKSIAKSAILGGRELQGESGIFWFVTCLFFTQQIMNALVPRYSRSTLLSIFGAMLALSYIHSSYFRQYWLPLNANVALAAAPICYAGYLFRQAENGLAVRILSVMVSLAAVALVIAGFNISCDMKAAVYGIPVISFVSALAIVILSIDAAKRIEKIPALFDALSALGRASLVVMFLHQTLLIHSKSYFGTEHEILRFSFAVLASYSAYELISRFSVTKALFLGSAPDFENLFIAANGGVAAHERWR